MRALSILFSFPLLCLAACSAPPLFADYQLPKSSHYEETGSNFAITPAHLADQSDQSVGVIFYPGGLVHPAAYIPLLAQLPYRSWIAKMPLDLAVLAPGQASQIQAAHPEITRWILAGHSLGAAMALRHLKQNRSAFAGLILISAYGDAAADLSQSDVPVLVLSGSQDGLVSAAEIAAGKPYLPVDTQETVLAGANHAQFGDYGKQKGDAIATITGAEQRQLAAERMQQFISSVLE